MPDTMVPIARKTGTSGYPRFITEVANGYKIKTTYNTATGNPNGGTTISPIVDGDELYIISTIVGGNRRAVEKQDFYFWLTDPFIATGFAQYQFVMFRFPEELLLSKWSITPTTTGAPGVGYVDSEVISDDYDPIFAWDNVPGTALSDNIFQLSFNHSSTIGIHAYEFEQSYFSALDYRRFNAGSLPILYGMALIPNIANTTGQPEPDSTKFVFGEYIETVGVDRPGILYPDSAWYHAWDKDPSW